MKASISPSIDLSFICNILNSNKGFVLQQFSGFNKKASLSNHEAFQISHSAGQMKKGLPCDQIIGCCLIILRDEEGRVYMKADLKKKTLYNLEWFQF